MVGHRRADHPAADDDDLGATGKVTHETQSPRWPRCDGRSRQHRAVAEVRAARSATAGHGSTPGWLRCEAPQRRASKPGDPAPGLAAIEYQPTLGRLRGSAAGGLAPQPPSATSPTADHGRTPQWLRCEAPQRRASKPRSDPAPGLAAIEYQPTLARLRGSAAGGLAPQPPSATSPTADHGSTPRWLRCEAPQRRASKPGDPAPGLAAIEYQPTLGRPRGSAAGGLAPQPPSATSPTADHGSTPRWLRCEAPQRRASKPGDPAPGLAAIEYQPRLGRLRGSAAGGLAPQPPSATSPTADHGRTPRWLRCELRGRPRPVMAAPHGG